MPNDVNSFEFMNTPNHRVNVENMTDGKGLRLCFESLVKCHECHCTGWRVTNVITIDNGEKLAVALKVLGWC